MSEGRVTRRDALRIAAVVGVSGAFGGGVVASLLRAGALRRVRQTRTRMGTVVTITVVHPEAEGARAMVDAAFAEMTRLEAALSRHREDAPLGRLNRTGRVESAPPELTEVLGAALELARRSEGAFDPTVLPILRAWEAARPDGLPDEATLREAHARVGWEGVHLAGDVVTLDDAGMALTLDGIAKGYVVDRTVAELVGLGAARVMVDAGGDMATGGAGSEEDPWTVALQDPADFGAAAGVVRLDGVAVATSGDYLQSFTTDRAEHHIIDPRTGRSPRETSAVSVVARTAMEADGLSTALLVLGPSDGLALLAGTPGAEALIIDKHGKTERSRGFPQHGV
jgi:thiamine biosynthesis lipoprotein